MKVLLTVCLLGSLWVSAQSACCPQPENANKCGCCPEACCCMCEMIPLTPPPCSVDGIDILYIADRSISIRSAGWARIQNFINELTPRFGTVGTDVRAAFITFSSMQATIMWDMASAKTDNMANFTAAVNGVPFVGAFTNTPMALQLGTTIFGGTNGDRDDSHYPDVAIFIGDGKTNLGKELVAQRAAELQDVTKLVFAIATDSTANFTELNIIADGNNNQSVFALDSLDSLHQIELVNDIETQLREALCSEILANAPTKQEHCKCCCPPLPKGNTCPCSGGSGADETGIAGKRRK